MGVEILITSREFRDQLKNGDDFLSNPSEFTTNLVGSVGDKIQVKRIIEIQWFSNATAGDPWTIETITPSTTFAIIRSAGNFITDGWAIGDEFDFIAAWINDRTSPIEQVGTITSISPDGKKIVFTRISGSFKQPIYQDAGIRGKTPLTALLYRWGLIENDENFNTESKVSGNDQAFYGSEIGFDTGGGVRDTNPVNMIFQGQYNDAIDSDDLCTAAYIQDLGIYTQQFEIIQVFTINPYYVVGQLQNLQNNILPPLFANNANVKQAIETEFRTVLSNPNTAKIQRSENNRGSTAWFNENFNGFDNDYNVLSVDYFETATPANTSTGLIVGIKTTVEVTVEKIVGSFSAADRFGLKVFYLPLDPDEYTDTLTFQNDNFIFNTAYNDEGAGATSSGIITSLTAALSGGDLVITAEILYSGPQQVRLTDASFFAICPVVADPALSIGNSNKVTLLADVKNFVKSGDIAGLVTVSKLNFYAHNEPIGVGAGSTDLDPHWPEDGFAIDGEFSVALDKDAVVNTLEIALIAYNSVKDISFDLDSFTFQIAGAVVSGGIQQLIVATTRNYNLTLTDQFNVVTLDVGALVVNDQFYSFQFGQKIKWQTWIANLLADTIFFDATKPNNNLNFKASNYSDLSDYEIKIAVRFNMFGTNTLGESGNTDYQFLSPDLKIFDYDLDENVTPDWIQVIETFNNDTTADLGGSILSGTDTLMRITWTNSGGPVTNTAGFYAIHRIETSEDTSDGIYELSSITAIVPPSGNLLKPVTGQTETTIVIDSGNVVTECLIDGSLISDTINYDLSGRLGDPGIPANFKTTAPFDGMKTTAPSDVQKTTAP